MIGTAEFMIKSKYTNKGKNGCASGMGAYWWRCKTQRPDLFKVASSTGGCVGCVALSKIYCRLGMGCNMAAVILRNIFLIRTNIHLITPT